MYISLCVKCRYSCQRLMIRELSRPTFEKYSSSSSLSSPPPPPLPFSSSLTSSCSSS